MPRKRTTLDIVVEEPLWRRRRQALALLRRAARLALKAAGPAAQGRRLTILLSDDAHLMELNAKFRRRRKPTNVLSFPSRDSAYLGDVAIAYQTVAREARAQGKRFSAHAAHLAAHGVLHLLGQDHKNTAEAERMEAQERRILGRLGLSDPYAARGKRA